MSPPMKFTKTVKTGFPRVSGDEPHLVSEAADLGAFSPRERG